MDNYVVDLEIAKELKKEGFPQEGLWWWQFTYEIKYTPRVKSGKYVPMGFKNCIAPISDEILKELPLHLEKKDNFYWLNISREAYDANSKRSYYEISYDNWENKCLDAICIEDDKLSNALAKMWLYLKKEGYIK